MYNEQVNYATKDYPFLIKHENVKYIPHFHEETEIVQVLEGELLFTLGIECYSIKAGDICIITPQQIHNLYTETYSLTYVMKLFPIVDLSGLRLETPILTKADPSYEKLNNYIHNIIRENENQEECYKLAVNVQAESIFLFILREMRYQNLDSRIKLKHITKNKTLDEINQFLEEHFDEDFSLDQIATKLNYTKSYFCRYFKKMTAMTFWEYFTMFRLEKSIQCMQDSPKENITVIANRAGFKNVHSYNTAFKSFHRCTPREYRERIKQK